jgi:hypothetical protein
VSTANASFSTGSAAIRAAFSSIRRFEKAARCRYIHSSIPEDTMAGVPQHSDPDFKHDMTPHLETWAHFNSIAKWTAGLTVLILVGMYVFLVPHG